MKELKSWIYRIIYLAVFFALCKTCISDHISGSSPDRIKNYETMIADNTVVQAELSGEYKEKTIKIMSIPVKTYEFDYTFFIDNKSYSGKVSLNKVPESLYVNIYYLRSNPKIISMNPVSDLKIEKEKGTSNSNLYWGIFFGILGFLGLISTVTKLTKKKDTKTPNNPVTTQPVQTSVLKENRTPENADPKINKEDPSRFFPAGFSFDEPKPDQIESTEPKVNKSAVSLDEEPILDKEDPRRFMPQ